MLPINREAAEYIWPAEHYGAVIHETGKANDELLNKLARELLKAGNPHVVAIRHSLVDIARADLRVFYYPEAQRVAA